MKMMKTILSLVVMAAALMGTAAAVNYTVGSPDGGWDQSTNLQTWPTSLTFVEGDNLIFRYTTNHDVTEVSRSDYESCRATNPLQPRLTGGAAVVPLTSAGTRYFICGSAGHCISGMKLAITTTAAASPPPPSTTTAPPPSSKTTTPSPPPPPPPPTTPSPTPKHSKAVMPTPPQPAASAPSGSALPPPTPPPSAAAKVGLIGGLIVMVLLVHVV